MSPDLPKIELLVVTEYFTRSGGPTGMQAGDLYDHIANRCPDILIRKLDTKKRYRPGSLQPRRIVHHFSLALRLPFVLIFHRLSAALHGSKCLVLATTYPVNFQIFTLLGCWLLRIPVALWLWDAHPEIESRLLRKRGYVWLSLVLGWIDLWTTQRFAGVIVMDQAMAADLVLRTQYRKKIALIMPWSTYIQPAKPIRLGDTSKKLRLLYAGNYGYAHDLAPLAAALKTSRHGQTAVEISFVGMSKRFVGVLREMFANTGATVSFWPRYRRLD